MSTHDDLAEDRIVLDRLRDALQPVPGAESVAALAKAAFTFRTMDAELAILEAGDADLMTGADVTGAGARESRFRGEPRVLVFRTEDIWIEVEYVDGDLVGQLTPAAEVGLSVEAVDGTSTRTVSDELGCFTVAIPSSGPVRLRLDADAAPVVTDWVVIR